MAQDIAYGLSSDLPRHDANIRRWLIVIAHLVVVMILIGGATRLTDSGLSITEWRPVTGLLPPIGEEAWLDEFIKYQGIPEYQMVNRGMTLDEFKTIFWWEWTHRSFGHVIALAFALPFAWFLATGAVRGWLAWRLGGILALGAFQAYVGWFMVQSGLAAGVDVSHYRLAAHLAIATAILALILWTVFDLGVDNASRSGRRARRGAGPPALVALVFLQIIAGALVAGLDAGHTYNTWPLMDGSLVPDGLLIAEPWYLNPFENVLTVQFDHRMIGYLIAIVAMAHAAVLWRSRPGTPLARSAWLVAGAVFVQVALGVATLVAQVPLALGLLHQAGAFAVFTLALRHLHIAGRPAAA